MFISSTALNIHLPLRKSKGEKQSNDILGCAVQGYWLFPKLIVGIQYDRIVEFNSHRGESLTASPYGL